MAPAGHRARRGIRIRAPRRSGPDSCRRFRSLSSSARFLPWTLMRLRSNQRARVVRIRHLVPVVEVGTEALLMSDASRECCRFRVVLEIDEEIIVVVQCRARGRPRPGSAGCARRPAATRTFAGAVNQVTPPFRRRRRQVVRTTSPVALSLMIRVFMTIRTGQWVRPLGNRDASRTSRRSTASSVRTALSSRSRL